MLNADLRAAKRAPTARWAICCMAGNVGTSYGLYKDRAMAIKSNATTSAMTYSGLATVWLTR